MKRLLLRAFAPAALATLVLGQPAVALEPLTGTGLVEACRAYQVDPLGSGATTCRAYIQGYLSASTEIVAAEDRPSQFVARAIRTRASRLSEDAEQRLSSRYCLPESETINALITKVAEVSPPLAEEATAESVMLTVFDRHYRCEDVIGK
ncbi:hypothetical protein [Microbulbifer hydrolyticus]|uniref:Rap1a immunity protein domain-containing protein n=1 Tax=Microbulbifer hydrolyticus TaxID=48074 RepID=A0A6P1T8P8_9GAMM|nr:hypothetical protein [Microbulbifer hydrolyticus]MBB5211020.1 hypothetical protein [Microbulbifer hydrolyticus]QHQ38171.1 hypothetical protein GTQ55_03645 [Microbulbifer hydrolyticus]